MLETVRRPLAAWTCAVLLASLSFSPCAAAAPAGGVILGSVTAPGGVPAAGWGVLLLSPEGDLVARAAVSPRGEYRFDQVSPGRYALAAQDSEGRFAPVAGAPTTVTGAAATRRDIRLVPTQGDGGALAQTVFGPRGESWWSRQTRNQKIWTVVGIALGTGVVLAVVNNLLDDDETPASAYR